MPTSNTNICIAFLPPTYSASIRGTQQPKSCRIGITKPSASPCKMLDNVSNNVTPEPRIACLCQYNGAAFSGWERKPVIRTVQSTIENAISAVCGSSVTTAGASKTDAGTHAIGQVFHFDPPFTFSNSRAWMRALNKHLPKDVLTLEAGAVPLSFHARKSAVWRRYRYTILTSTRNSVFLSPFVWHLYQRPLNVTSMNAAAQTLRCHLPKDFSAFRKTRSSAAHSNIVVHDISVHRGVSDPNLVEIEVCASWFVYGMMRLLTAALVEVGSGNMAVEEFYNIFRLRQRHRIRNSAPASGLCLLEVGYPSQRHPFANSEQLHGSSGLTLGLSPYFPRG